MSTRHAVLGLLCQRPSYPYEIAARFADRIGRQWDLNRGQVYQAVQQLEREGLIERVRSRPCPRGDRWVYRATESGEREFERWFERGATPLRPLRCDLFVKLALSRREQAPHLIDLTRQHEFACVERLAEYADARGRATTVARKSTRWQPEMSQVVLDAAMALLETEIAWLRETRAKLEALAGASTARADGRGFTRRWTVGLSRRATLPSEPLLRHG